MSNSELTENRIDLDFTWPTIRRHLSVKYMLLEQVPTHSFTHSLVLYINLVITVYNFLSQNIAIKIFDFEKRPGEFYFLKDIHNYCCWEYICPKKAQ